MQRFVDSTAPTMRSTGDNPAEMSTFLCFLCSLKGVCVYLVTISDTSTSRNGIECSGILTKTHGSEASAVRDAFQSRRSLHDVRSRPAFAALIGGPLGNIVCGSRWNPRGTSDVGQFSPMLDGGSPYSFSYHAYRQPSL